MKFKNETAGGFPVRILATDIDSDFSIVAAVDLGKGEETVYVYREDGTNDKIPDLSLVPTTSVKKYQVLFQLRHKQGIAMAVSNTYFESMENFHATGIPFSKYNRILPETGKWFTFADKTETSNKYTPMYQVLFVDSAIDGNIMMAASVRRYRSLDEFYAKEQRIPKQEDRLLEETAVFYDEQGNEVG